MAYKYKKKNFSRRKRFYKKRSFRRRRTSSATVNVQRNIGFADSTVVRLKLTQVISYVFPNTTYGRYFVVHANSMFNPIENDNAVRVSNYSYRDTWASLYAYATITSLKFKMTVLPASQNAFPGVICSCPMATIPAVPDFSVLNENPYAKKTFVTTQNGSRTIATLQQYVDIAKISGVTKDKVRTDDLFQCNSNGTNDPANQVYILITINNIGNAQGPNTYYCTFEMEATVKFTERYTRVMDT